MTHTPSLSGLVEALEPRIVLSATPLSVGRALDLSDDVTVVLSGNGLSFATQTLGSTGQFLGFPSGPDGDFLILSTGIASHVFTWKNTGDAQGTDLGPVGEEGDTVSVQFTLPVPQGASQQRLKLDFMFLTDEFPEFVGADFNDTFEVLIDGVNFAQDEFGNAIEVDNAFFTGEDAPGTYFDGRTNRLTLTYIVPDGVTSLHVELRLKDVGDGEVDSAVLVDNVRFESPQVVYLNFDGATLAGHFGPGITAMVPAFDPSDLGSAETTEALIQQIVAMLEEKFAPYDIFFTTVMPAAGDFTTIVIGGDNTAILDISAANPLLRNSHPGSSVSVADLFDLGGDTLLGFAGAPDVGNFDRNDRAVIFSGEFDNFFSDLTAEERLNHLVVTIAHELGHNLGLRHLDDSATADIMKQTAPRLANATFGNTLFGLAEQWSDGATEQNDHVYLSSVLGKGNASGLAVSVPQTDGFFSTSGSSGPLHDVTITITTGEPDAAPLTLHFATLDATRNLPLPNLPLGAKIALVAASTPGGPLNIFSGTPAAGQLAHEASFVPLFGLNGALLPIPLAKGAPGALVANGSLSLAANDLGDVTIIAGKAATFTDADGDIYTVRLTGPGMMGYVLDDPDLDGKGGLAKLRLDDTVAGVSILTITVKKSRFGDGFVNFGEISGAPDAGLKALAASKVNIVSGGVIFGGAIGNIVIRDLLDGANLIAGAAEGMQTNLTARLIGDGSDVAVAGAVGTMKVARIGAAGVNVLSLAKLIVAGDRANGIAGDIGGQINVSGLLGSVKARDLLPGASIDAGGEALDRTTLALHDVMNGTSIALASTVVSLKAARIGDAQIRAQQFDSIAVTGDARNFIPGDFGADLVANNKIGKFLARDLLSTASIEAGGLVFDKTTFTARGIMDGVSIALESSVSKFRAAYVGLASIEVAAIATLQVLGDANAFLLGDFRGSLTLTGGDAFFVNTLGTALIKGTVEGATIVADAIGVFNARGIVGSTITAGFTPADPGAPFEGGAFAPDAAIKALIVGNWGFADSVVASAIITSISIASLSPFNGGETFGILMDVAPARVSVAGFAYVKNGAADQFFGDFHVTVL